MRDLDGIVKELQRGGRGGRLEKLGDTADGKKLESMVDAQALERAMKSGDAAALKGMLSSLLATPEGRRLAGEVKKVMEQ